MRYEGLIHVSKVGKICALFDSTEPEWHFEISLLIIMTALWFGVVNHCRERESHLISIYCTYEIMHDRIN